MRRGTPRKPPLRRTEETKDVGARFPFAVLPIYIAARAEIGTGGSSFLPTNGGKIITAPKEHHNVCAGNTPRENL